MGQGLGGTKGGWGLCVLGTRTRSRPPTALMGHLVRERQAICKHELSDTRFANSSLGHPDRTAGGPRLAEHSCPPCRPCPAPVSSPAPPPPDNTAREDAPAWGPRVQRSARNSHCAEQTQKKEADPWGTFQSEPDSNREMSDYSSD